MQGYRGHGCQVMNARLGACQCFPIENGMIKVFAIGIPSRALELFRRGRSHKVGTDDVCPAGVLFPSCSEVRSLAAWSFLQLCDSNRQLQARA